MAIATEAGDRFHALPPAERKRQAETFGAAFRPAFGGMAWACRQVERHGEAEHDA